VQRWPPRLTSDTARVGDTLVLLIDLVPDVVVLFGTLGLLVVLDLPLALVALSVLPVLAAAAARPRRLLGRAARRSRAAAGRLAAAGTDVLHNVVAVQAIGQRRRAGAMVGAQIVDTLEAALAAIAVRARWAPRADVLLATGTGLVLLIGTRRVLDGALSTGELLVVLAYLKGLYRPVRSLARSWSALTRAAVSRRRVADVLGCEERVADPERPLPLPASGEGIAVRDVGFGYRHEESLLHRLDLWIRTGETGCWRYCGSCTAAVSPTSI
jgi:ATP-binding cassette subfamily B protein